ncbi:hypothetical protein [Paraburkholderia solisilvae]|uniref:Chemotaxis phosphatase CheX-like domain-containing protein n=1 Tax=Paraburkholderia solisilvae TaxID=624376 RepID=A0A6J5EB68_9BURK|nr:hypothetical protein [Paraburkholderia solisilvae]CAB3762295.1 hypothetical protein LMG29739_03846 [Paraburkholderia solisilvae]
MISAQAKQSFERILHKAAQTRLTTHPDDTCSVVPRASHDAAGAAAAATNVVILTISSITFRLLLILHVDEDPATVEYFTKGDTERPFREVFQEICNLCCGAINQELLNYFPDLGMSTPYMLSARCLPYLEGLRPELLATYAVTLNGSIELAATLCVCAHAPIDFAADVSVAEDTSGELELF